MRISRRGVLAGAAIGGGLVVAWGLLPRSFDTPLSPGRGEYAFGAWIKIARDGVVTVAVPQLEMGQGVTTILPQIVAVELGADWRQIAVEPAPPSGAYANVPLAAKWAPLWMPLLPELAESPDGLLPTRFAQDNRFDATANGTTLAAYEQPCREAAAAARAMLCKAAARQWDVGWEECDAAAGFVLHENKRLSFARLADAAAQEDAPDPPVLRAEAAAEEPLPGLADAEIAFPRLDLPAKVDGSFLFAGDVRLPDMLFAAIHHGPLGKAELARFEAARARDVAGLVQVVRGKRWLAAVATNWWAAERALGDMRAVFRLRGPIEGQEVEQALDDAVRHGDAYRIAQRGEDYDSGGKSDLALRYDVAPALHATLETASATARLANGRLELWIASQAPECARKAAAKALGMNVADVVLYPMPAGGSFDRRLEHDHAIEVALLAREVGKPVQLVWSRWQEAQAGRPRTPVAALLSARISAEEGGRITAMRSRIAAPASAREFGLRLFENRTAWSAVEDSAGRGDPMVAEGAMPAYAIPNVTVDHVPAQIGLPTGRMRGNAHGYTAFFTESFIDEVAARNGREPLSYRIEMLGGDARMVECLQRAARLADWGGGKDNSGQGLACHRMGNAQDGGRIACIATARRQEGGVRVEKLSVAVDIGRIVNLDIARQQIEGGLIFGLSLALGSSTSYLGGVPGVGRLAAMALPVLADSPEIEVDFIASTATPFDPGELGVAVAAPAIANALYSATGLRMRRLPLLSEGL
ncbi:MAG: xanthine dehydrogenase family protein molybdopterin-binding subunit [Sphingomonadales bacterium]|nr:xanthine dehydrogenase family protein molybdopterin-binding subunit [Sphingomonadales bacterium]MBD3773061.1 xanthine dehydrogenase family protein molybdopterin-binding subunit [Paracoccaceae bacterium]